MTDKIFSSKKKRGNHKPPRNLPHKFCWRLESLTYHSRGWIPHGDTSFSEHIRLKMAKMVIWPNPRPWAGSYLANHFPATPLSCRTTFLPHHFPAKPPTQRIYFSHNSDYTSSSGISGPKKSKNEVIYLQYLWPIKFMDLTLEGNGVGHT